MFWSNVKVHKQTPSHLLQSLQFAEADFSGVNAESVCDEGSDFQMTQFCQPGSVSDTGRGGDEDGPASQHHEDFVSTMAGLREQQEQEMNNLLGALAAGLEEVGVIRDTVLKNSTEDMLRLVMAIAEQVILCEVSANPSIIISTLQKALQSAISSSEYHVKLHPDDLAIAMLKKPLFMSSISGLKNITLEADQNLTRGGCLVESELGQVDATIESQLEELRQQLMSVEVQG